MSLQADIHARFGKVDDRVGLLKRMGYTNPGEQAISRLLQVLEDPDLGLGQGHYDLVHGTRSFLLALCAALDMDGKACRVYADDVIARLRRESEACQPWLWVRSRQADEAMRERGVMGKWGLHGLRRIPMPTQMRGMPLEGVVAGARDMVGEHMHTTAGALAGKWRIDGYRLFHATDQAPLELDVLGRVVGVEDADGVDVGSG